MKPAVNANVLPVIMWMSRVVECRRAVKYETATTGDSDCRCRVVLNIQFSRFVLFKQIVRYFRKFIMDTNVYNDAHLQMSEQRAGIVQ